MENSEDKWKEFKEYCRQDVEVTIAMHIALEKHLKENPEDKENRIAIFAVASSAVVEQLKKNTP